MKRRAVGLAVVAIGLVMLVMNGGCGGAKDSGLFGAATDAGVAKDARASTVDSGGVTGDDDQATADSGVPIDDATAGDDVATIPPVDDASTGVPITPCANANPNSGVVTVNADNTSYALANSTWQQHGANGADSMNATWGSQCDGQVDLITYNHAGTFDVTARLQNAGLVEGPRLSFLPKGDDFIAGFDAANGCNPCGSGTITVSSWASGDVSGSFDVMAKKAGSGNTRHFTGTFSFHK